MNITMKSHGWTKIGTASRDTMPTSARELPGPDRYNSQDAIKLKNSSPRPVFGRSLR